MHQRLFEILYLLIDKQSVTARELAARFGVSTRTIYRDIDTLSVSGIPVYTEKGRGGGIRILSDFVLNKSLFSTEEQSQLIAHFQSLASIGTPDTQPILEKLGALFGRGANWLDVDFTPWGDDKAAQTLFRNLRSAILHQNIISFQYINSGGLFSQRTAEPLQIIFRGQSWYLSAFCRLKQDFRLFKFSRIHNLSVLPETFIPKPAPQKISFAPSGLHSTPILLRLAPAAAYRVVDEFPTEQTALDDDGYFLINCSFPLDEWVVGYVLSFGQNAEVLKPESLRSIVINRLAKMQTIYGNT